MGRPHRKPRVPAAVVARRAPGSDHHRPAGEVRSERDSGGLRHSFELDRKPAGIGALAIVLQLTVGAGGATAQAAARPKRDCDGRAPLQISVVDESGFVSIPEATVVLHGTDAVRRPVRETADPDGRLPTLRFPERR